MFGKETGGGADSNAVLNEAKKHLFVHLRNAIMTADKSSLQIAEKFQSNVIVKLDYNEDDRSSATK